MIAYGNSVYPAFLNIKRPVGVHGSDVDGYLDIDGVDYNFVFKKENVMHLPNPVDV